jgi:gliding motility-associated-like protein
MIFYNVRATVFALLLFFPFSHLNGFGQIIVPSQSCSNVETFDNANPWTFGGVNSTWTWANPNKLHITDDITIGGKALILGGNTMTSTYNQNEESWAESPSYNLSAVDNPYLSFYFYWSNEGSTNFDEIWMEYSLNNGATWTDLATPIGTGSCYDQNWYNYPDNWGGNVGGCFPGLGGPAGWVLVRKCINSLGNEPNVKFRFRISTGTTCQNYGATIDNFKICDAGISADAGYQCTQQPLEIEFYDASYDCPTDWKWYFGDGDSADVQNPIHSYANGGIYSVTLIATTNTSVTSGCGGPYSDTFNFDIEVIDVAINTLSDVTCSGLSDGTASINVVGAKPNATMSWSPAPALGQGTTNISGLQAGNYTLLVTGENTSCTASIDVTIVQPMAINASYISADATCYGACDGTITTNITGGSTPYSVSWMPGAYTGMTVNALCAGSYGVNIVDINGCVYSEPSAAVISEPSVAEILNFTDTSLCNGAQVNLTNYQTTPGVSLVEWEVINGIDIGFGLNGIGDIPTFRAIGPAIAQVVLTPQVNAQCVGNTDTFSISVLPEPSPDFSFLADGTCEPLQVKFNIHDAEATSTYRWRINQMIERIGNPMTYEFNAGTHSVSLIETTINGCSGRVDKSDLFIVSPKPVANFAFSPNFYSDDGSEVDFINQSIDAVSYNWTIPALNFVDSTESINVMLSGNAEGYYNVELTAVNNDGCSDMTSKYIKMQASEIFYIPNAFSPFNGGVNNIFKPIVTSGIDIYNYKLIIYNRWGEIIFISHNPTEGWDGRLKSGQLMPSDVYTYQLFFNSPYQNNPKTIVGSVTLID